MSYKQRTIETTDEQPDTMVAVIKAMNDLPILSRLEFVANILFDRGGSRDALPRDWLTVTATEVLHGVIDVLKKHPHSANLRGPEP